jgi:flagellar biosynthesis chaperone FliJ
MPNEIDNLEIVVEAEASKANRSLGKMEKRLDRIANSLLRISMIAKGKIDLDEMISKSLSSASQSASSAKKLGDKMANNLISGFNLGKAGKEVTSQVRQLSSKIASEFERNGLNSSYAEDLDQLGKLVAKNGTIAESVDGDYQRLYETIKSIGKIKISPQDASSIGDDYKDRSGILRSKMSTKEGIPLDSLYQELSDQFKGILPDASKVGSVEDQFYALNEAMQKFYQLRNQSSTKPEWLEDSAYEAVADEVKRLYDGIKNTREEMTQMNSCVKDLKSLSESMDFSGIEGAKTKSGNTNNAPRENRSDIKYNAKSIDDLFEKFRNAGTDTDFSDMGLSELERKAKSLESQLDRLYASMDKKENIEGTKRLGKTWESLVYDISKASNELDSVRERISQINAESSKMEGLRIHRMDSSGSPDTSSAATSSPDVGSVIKRDAGAYEDPSKSLQDFMANLDKAGSKAETFEDKIKSIKKELDTLSNAGLGEGNAEYDAKYMELERVTQAYKAYKKEMRERVKSDTENEKIGALGRLIRQLKKAINAVKDFNSKMKKGARYGASFASKLGKISSAILHPIKSLKKLKNAITETRNEGNRRWSLGRMIKSSILMSGIFQIISAIKSAISEGSSNLVAYGGAYKSSINSIVSSLNYLKNAWAAAFAPIVNAVAPYLNAFLDMVASALNSVGKLLASLTGKGFAVQAKKVSADVGSAADSTASGLSNANDKAEELKRTLMGFDQINKLDDPTSSSGSGSGGSGGSSTGTDASNMFTTVEIDDSTKELASMIKDAWDKADFTDIGQLVGNKVAKALASINWDEYKKTANKLGKSLATFINGAVTSGYGGKSLGTLIGESIGESFNVAVNAVNSFVKNLKWNDVGSFIAQGINGAVGKADFSKLGSTISTAITGIQTTILTALEEIEWTKIGNRFGEFITSINWGEILINGIQISLNIPVAMFKTLLGFGESIAAKIYEGITGAKMSQDDKDTFYSKVEKALGLDKPVTYEITPVAQYSDADVIVDIWNGIKSLWSTGEEKNLTYNYSPAALGNGGKQKTSLSKIWESIKSLWDGDNDKNLTYQTSPKSLGKDGGGLGGVISDISDYWKKHKPNLSVPFSVPSIVTKLSDVVSKARAWWKKHKPSFSLPKFKLGIKLPKFFISFTNKGVSKLELAAWKKAGYSGRPIIDFAWKEYAKGGFPEEGPFMMNRGEIAGKFSNGKSVVANNKQITDGIAQAVGPAVYSAMVDALSSTNGNSGNVKIILEGDAKGLFRAVKKEADSYTASTGNPAFAV